MVDRRDAKRKSSMAKQTVAKRVKNVVQVVENGEPAAEQQPAAVAPQPNGPQEVELARPVRRAPVAQEVAPRRSRRLIHPLNDHNDDILLVIIAITLSYLTLPLQLSLRGISRLFDNVMTSSFVNKYKVLVMTLKDANRVQVDPVLSNQRMLNYGSRRFYDANMRDHLDKLKNMQHREIVITSRHFNLDTVECIGKLFGQKLKHLVVVLDNTNPQFWFHLQMINKFTALESLAVIDQNEAVNPNRLSYLFQHITSIPSELHLCFNKHNDPRDGIYPALPAQSFERVVGQVRRFTMTAWVENQHEIIQAVGRNIAQLPLGNGQPAPKPLESIGMQAILGAAQLGQIMMNNPALGQITHLQLYSVDNVNITRDHLAHFPMLQSLQLWGPRPFSCLKFTRDHLAIVSRLAHLRDLSLFALEFRFDLGQEIQPIRSEVTRLQIVCAEFFSSYLLRYLQLDLNFGRPQLTAEDSVDVLRPLIDFSRQFPMLTELTIEANLGSVLPLIGVIKQELVKLFLHLTEEKVRLVNNRVVESRFNDVRSRKFYEGNYAVY